MSDYALFDAEPPRARTGPERHLNPRTRASVLAAETLAKAKGQHKAIQAAPVPYRARFEAAVKYFANGTPPAPFTVDDIIGIVGLPSSIGERDSNNAVGALMARIAKAGLIRPIGWQESTRKGNHARPVRVWEGMKK